MNATTGGRIVWNAEAVLLHLRAFTRVMFEREKESVLRSLLDSYRHSRESCTNTMSVLS